METDEDRIRILCVDDHSLIRDGIKAVIATQSDMVVIAEAMNGLEAIELYRIHQPDVTLMDIRMPDMSGIDVIVRIRAEYPRARIIMLTTYKGDMQALRAFKAGASGYLLKSMLRKEMLDTIRTVHAGRRRIPQEIAAELAEHASDDVLTSRELQVLKEVAAGNANKIVADRLHVTEETIKAHMKSILSKLSANDRTHAVMIAIKRGILDLE